MAKLLSSDALRPCPGLWLFSATSVSGFRERGALVEARKARFLVGEGPECGSSIPALWNSRLPITSLKRFNEAHILFLGVCSLLGDSEGEF